MDLNKLTIKSQEALTAAQSMATELNHQQVEPAHLLAALLGQAEGVTYPILQKLGASPRALRERLQGVLDGLPKVYGQVETYISQPLRSLLEQAFKEAEGLGDAYVSTEHLLLALLEQKDDTASVLLEAGIDRTRLLQALKEVRGSQHVTDQTPEDKYQALERFGRDLTEAARRGKLDPVIGRDDEIRRVIQVLSRWTWGRWSPAPSTGVSSRNGSRPCSRRSRTPRARSSRSSTSCTPSSGRGPRRARSMPGT